MQPTRLVQEILGLTALTMLDAQLFLVSRELVILFYRWVKPCLSLRNMFGPIVRLFR